MGPESNENAAHIPAGRDENENYDNSIHGFRRCQSDPAWQVSLEPMDLEDVPH